MGQPLNKKRLKVMMGPRQHAFFEGAIILRMRTTTSPKQWQPRTAASALLGLISMAKPSDPLWTQSTLQSP